MRDKKIGFMSTDMRLEIMTSMPGFDNRTTILQNLMPEVVETVLSYCESLPENFAEGCEWKNGDRIGDEFLENHIDKFLEMIKTSLYENLEQSEWI